MKTADEMFRELGYEKGEWNRELCYRNRETEIIIAQKSAFPIPYVTAWESGDRMRGLTADEILACAQLIHEMEANHD